MRGEAEKEKHRVLRAMSCFWRLLLPHAAACSCLMGPWCSSCRGLCLLSHPSDHPPPCPTQLEGGSGFRAFLDLVPDVRGLARDVAESNYGPALCSLEAMRSVRRRLLGCCSCPCSCFCSCCC